MLYLKLTMDGFTQDTVVETIDKLEVKYKFNEMYNNKLPTPSLLSNIYYKLVPTWLS